MRPEYYRYWHDPGIKRTRRRSMQSTVLEAAKQELINIMQTLEQVDDIDSGPFISDLTLTNQRRIWSFMANEELSSKSISTYSIAPRAAVNFASQAQIVEKDGVEREIKLLTEAVKIECSHKKIADYLNLPIGGRCDFLPKFEQMAEWIDAI